MPTPNATRPACGHSVLKADCEHCKALQKNWYSKIVEADPDWRDIEYGLDAPERLYEPGTYKSIDPIATAYYNKVLDVYHLWLKEGRSKRDCIVAELLGRQEGDLGTERGIAAHLRSKRFKPNSRFTVRQTIKEINAIIFQKAQGHLSGEQSRPALSLLDSKPLKEEANGKEQAPGAGSRAA